VRLPFVSPRLDALPGGFASARRVYGHDPCHLRWNEDVSPEMRDAWFATPFDGDYSFCLRPPPLLATVRAA
jgi:Fe-S oxidoreductase